MTYEGEGDWYGDYYLPPPRYEPCIQRWLQLAVAAERELGGVGDSSEEAVKSAKAKIDALRGTTKES